MNRQWREIIRFVAVGVVATALHYLFYYLLLYFVGHNLAYTVGYLLSFVCNYLLSSLFTFRVQLSWQRLAGFSLSHLINYLAGLALLNLFIWLGLSATIAPLPVFVLVVPINFLLVRFALKRRSGDNDGYLLFLMLAGFAMLLLQLTDVPTLSDDLLYRFIWNADEQAPVYPVQSLSDLLHSQLVHYQVLNGRVVVHTLAQAFFAFVPPVVLHVLNALLFVLLLHLLTRWTEVASSTFVAHASQRGSSANHPLLISSLAACLLFVVFRGVSTTMLWSLGIFNYLWVSVATLALLLMFFASEAAKAERKSIRLRSTLRSTSVSPIHWFLAPLALLIGNGHEAASLPLSVAFIVYIWYYRHGILRSALLPYMLFYVAGAAIVMLSPGIWQRAADAVSLQSRLISGAVNLLTNMRVSWLLLLALLFLWRRRPAFFRSFVHSYRYLFVAWAVSLAIIIVCGVNLERVAFYTDFFALLLLLPIVAAVADSILAKRLTAISLLLLLLFFIPAYLLRKEHQRNTLFMQQQMAAPHTEIVAVRSMPYADNWLCRQLTERYVFPSAEFGFFCCYMGFNPHDINMRCAARLYNKPQLVFLPEDVVSSIAADSTAFSRCRLDLSGQLYVYRLPHTSAPSPQLPSHQGEGPWVGSGLGYAACKARISRLTFLLSPEDPSKLLPHQRLMVYPGDRYDLDSTHYQIINVAAHSYLVFTRPTTNIYRRVHHIEYAVSPH